MCLLVVFLVSVFCLFFGLICFFVCLFGFGLVWLCLHFVCFLLSFWFWFSFEFLGFSLFLVIFGCGLVFGFLSLGFVFWVVFLVLGLMFGLGLGLAFGLD